jgi:phosphoribosylaminoimidazole-succinocarboxamide synthase
MTWQGFRLLERERLVKHHLMPALADPVFDRLAHEHPELIDNCLIWRKTEPILIEFVARRYITGSLWSAYQKSDDKVVWGIQFPMGLADGDDLGEVYFTPTTKSQEHDEPLTPQQYRELMVGWFGVQRGNALAEELEEETKTNFRLWHEYCLERKVVAADGKYEYGMLLDVWQGRKIPLLIDEVHTPDACRFWPLGEWQVRNLVSLDKQFVRDDSLKAAKEAGVERGTKEFDAFLVQRQLPDQVVEQTQDRYLQVENLLAP